MAAVSLIGREEGDCVTSGSDCAFVPLFAKMLRRSDSGRDHDVAAVLVANDSSFFPFFSPQPLLLSNDDCVKDLGFSSSFQGPPAQMKTNRCASVKSIMPQSPAPAPSYLLPSEPRTHVGAPFFVLSPAPSDLHH